MDEEFKEFKKELVELANANIAMMDGTTAPIRQLFETNEVVVAVWQDKSMQDGVDLLVLKGNKRLKEILASGESDRVKITAIPCECYEQAIAAKQVFGERDHDA